MKAGGDHAADPITMKMLADLRRAEIAGPLMQQAAEDDGGEVDLSLGLSIGGGNKRKVGAGVYLNGSVGDSAHLNRKCRARVEAEAKEEEVGGLRVSDVRTQNPVVVPNPVVPVYVPVPGGSKLSRMVTCCTPPPPVVVSDSGRSFLHPISCRSLPPFAGPNIDHCPSPNRSREIGEKSSAMIKRAPSFSASPVRSYSGPLRGRSSSSSETRSNSTNLGAGEKPKEHAGQEAMSKPRAQSQAAPPANIDQMPCVVAKGADGKVVSGFLYSYDEKEVSIVCVCHGSCFSPAGFVRHAGGVESSHPLRQITVVVPS